MKRSLLYIALLLIAAQGICAEKENYYPDLINPTPSKGPWTFDAVNTHYGNKNIKSHSFNSMNHIYWNDQRLAYQFNDGDGLGFKTYFDGEENDPYSLGLYSTYYHHETVPPYTRKQLTWQYTLRVYVSMANQACGALYALDDINELKNMSVDFSYDYSLKPTNPYVMAQKDRDSEGDSEADKTKVFEFDNRNGSETAVKSWYLLMTQVASSCHYGGEYCEVSFKNRNATWATFYYKYISFDANGGVGTMATQEIENSDNLTANAFTRAGYTFAGWAMSANGPVAYADGAAVTASESDKGPVTLYAVWKPTVETVEALINAIGEVVYTTECKARIDAAHAAYTKLSAEEQSQVDNYGTLVAAEATYLAIQNVVTKITAIGEVTAASGDAIAAARAAYNELTEAQKPLVINYSALVDAEAQYAILPVVTAIDAIGEVTAESGKAIADARAAYDALSNTQKSLVTNYATLLAAEAAYADLGKTTVLYVDKAGTDTIHTQRKSVAYPALPEDAIYWQTVEKSASDNTIVIKAVE